MKLNREQINSALKTLEGAKVMVANRDFNDFQNAIITAINALSTVEKLTEETVREFANYLKEHSCSYDLDNYHSFDAVDIDNLDDYVEEFLED